MEIKKWVIDSFFFPYKNKNYIVILKLYRENEKRPSKYAKATVEFIKQENVNVSIKGCYQYLELLKRVNKIFDLRVFYEKGIDNLDTVIEEASHTIENMEMLFMGSVYDLAKFDEQDFVDEYLSECYAEAYDEKLDYYVDKAMSAASNAFAELAEEAKDEADMLLRQIEELETLAKKCTEIIQIITIE